MGRNLAKGLRFWVTEEMSLYPYTAYITRSIMSTLLDVPRLLPRRRLSSPP